MIRMICPICANTAPVRLKKGIVEYFQCSSCHTLFSEPLENAGMIGGGNEEQRNTVQNADRIERIKSLMRNSEEKVLDYGCGHGILVDDLRKAGVDADGFALYNPDFEVRPKKDVYSIVSMIEVIEHTSAPFLELAVINRALRPGGFLMVETSFVDIALEEGIELESFFYVEPKVGHATIFSHHGLDVLMCLKGFLPVQHFNRNCRLFIKK